METVKLILITVAGTSLALNFVLDSSDDRTNLHWLRFLHSWLRVSNRKSVVRLTLVMLTVVSGGLNEYISQRNEYISKKKRDEQSTQIGILIQQVADTKNVSTETHEVAARVKTLAENTNTLVLHSDEVVRRIQAKQSPGLNTNPHGSVLFGPTPLGGVSEEHVFAAENIGGGNIKLSVVLAGCNEFQVKDTWVESGSRTPASPPLEWSLPPNEKHYFSVVHRPRNQQVCVGSIRWGDSPESPTLVGQVR